MSNVKNLDEMRNTISKDNLIIDDENIHNIECGLCKQILNRPCVASCGCQYCEKCLEKRLCGGGGVDCNKEELVFGVNVFRDYKLDDTVERFADKCPNEYCHQRLELSLLDEHLRVCDKKLMSCPYLSIGCEEGPQAKDILMKHMVTGSFLHSRLMTEALDNMQDEVKNLVTLVKQLREDSLEKDKIIINLQQVVDKQEIDIRKHSQEIENRRKEDTTVQTQIGLMKQDIERVEDRVLNAKPHGGNDIAEVVASTEEIKKNVDNLTLRVRDLQIYEEKDFLWKINNFTIKRRDRRYMTSNTFYRDSYNLCMDVWFSSDHIGIDCCIMKGQYDGWSTIVWPMCRTVTLSILNQNTLLPYKTERFHYSTYLDKAAFNRPISEWNNGIGNPTFILIEELMNVPEVLINDSVIVSCVIDIF